MKSDVSPVTLVPLPTTEAMTHAFDVDVNINNSDLTVFNTCRQGGVSCTVLALEATNLLMALGVDCLLGVKDGTG